MVGNFVLRRRVNGAVKRNLQHKTHDLTPQMTIFSTDIPIKTQSTALLNVFTLQSIQLCIKIPWLQIWDNLVWLFFFYIENGILCVLIRIASMRGF